ncbi:hypothetical protein GCM10009872_52950 [Actinopolymorpha rutila]
MLGLGTGEGWLPGRVDALLGCLLGLSHGGTLELIPDVLRPQSRCRRTWIPRIAEATLTDDCVVIESYGPSRRGRSVVTQLVTQEMSQGVPPGGDTPCDLRRGGGI